ncbi:glycosyltransferase [Streptomyces sp. NPDC046831]|uniref:glycosyltransferase n=1 Tax=Streptomyces sp. NPDC046831 TaxID=3154805 RepID=UPI0033F61C14
MEKTAPLCSVVVPTYNRERLLRLTLESLARQTLPADAFEVLVADDGSADGSAAVAAEFEQRLRLRYLYQEDQGYRVAAARNLGLAHASAPVTVFVDSGVILHSGALAAHVDSHRDTDGPVAVCGYVYCFNEDNEDGALIERAIDYADPDATMAELARQGRWLDIREEFYAKYTDDIAGLPAPWLVWWTCNVSARTEQLRAVGGFDEAYRSWGAEDVDLSYRLHRDGARFVLNRAASAIHVPHPKSYSENMRAVAGNYRYFAEKYDTPITRLVPDHHFFEINDLIAERRLPSCPDHLRTPDPEAGSVLVFAPHPDDDVIACGGTIARRTAQGARVGIVFSTDGSRSHSAVLGMDTPTPEELTVIRKGEAEAAARRLGVDAAALRFLGFTDTALADALPDFRTGILKVLAENREVAEVYLPHDVKELNADHRLTGEVVLECLQTLGMTPKIHKYVVWDEQTEAEFVFVNRNEPDPERTAPERLLARDIAPQLPAKRAALREHRTQVTLYAPGQQRTVVPPAFVERVCEREVEEFWVADR